MTALENSITHSKQISPRTKELYLQHVRAFLVFAGNVWTKKMALKWRDDMRRRKIRPQSINVALNALRFAAKNAKLNFVKKIETLPAGKPRPRANPLTLSEGRRLIEECTRGISPGLRARGLRDVAIVMLGLRTGMQRASMCALQIQDVKQEKATLVFIKKGGKEHKIALDPLTFDAVVAWINWLKSKKITSGYLFRSLGRSHLSDDTPIGKQLTPDGLYRALQQRAESARLDDLSPHAFRRTFTAWAKNAGATPEQIAVVTGHKPVHDEDEDEDTDATENSDDIVPANFLIPDFSTPK